MKQQRLVAFSLALSVVALSHCLVGLSLPGKPSDFALGGTVPQKAKAQSKTPPPAKKYAPSGGPPTLTYSELIELSQSGDMIRPELKAKIDKLLNTPFIGNTATAKPHTPTDPKLGKFVRIAEWNIERGLNFEMVVAALSDPVQYARMVDTKEHSPQSDFYREALDQVNLLKDADILVLNELDRGMKRTDYRFVAQELAKALNMNFVYGVEFLEIDPVQLGTEEFEGMPTEEREKLKREIAVDPKRYLGLHGSAVLTRFPILKATTQPFTPAYDWYHEELKPVSIPEKGKRAAVDKIFLEKILREIRRGGRTMIRVDLDVPDLPEKTLTIIAPHIENKCKPEGRRMQLNEVLTRIQDIPNPVVVAGDMNTTLTDGTPTTIKREITKRVGSKEFWAVQGLKYATGVGLIWDVVTGGINFLKNQHDPTAKHIPVVAPNPEVRFFEDLEKYRFTDGFAFDFRGDKSRTIDGREGTLANSNQRDTKGFATTFEVERKVGPTGTFKLDWFFVKAYSHDPRSDKESYRFAPHFGRTMYEVNNAVPDRVSDHCPITVDLPFGEPR